MQATEALCHLNVTDNKETFCNVWFFCKNEACGNGGILNATTLIWLLTCGTPLITRVWVFWGIFFIILQINWFFTLGGVHKRHQQLEGGGRVKNWSKLQTDSTKNSRHGRGRGCQKSGKKCRRRLWMVPLIDNKEKRLT